MNFEEIIKRAHEVADARTKVYNDLKNKLEEEYIPTMQTIMARMGVESVKIVNSSPMLRIKSSYSNDYNTQDKYEIDMNEIKYCIYITQDTIQQGGYDYEKGWYKRNSGEYKIINNSVVFLANKVKSIIEDLIKKAETEKKSAEEALVM